MYEFRACFVPALEASSEEFYSEIVGSYELAKTILENIANYTLYLHGRCVMQDFSNYGWVEQKVKGEWIAFEDEQDS